MTPSECHARCLQERLRCFAYEVSRASRWRCELHRYPIITHADPSFLPQDEYQCTLPSLTAPPPSSPPLLPVPPPPTPPTLASCAAHAACSGLIGDCCPTAGANGIMLQCCETTPLPSGFAAMTTARFSAAGTSFGDVPGCCPSVELSVPQAWEGGFQLVVLVRPWVAGRVLLLTLPGMRMRPSSTPLEILDGQLWNAEPLAPPPPQNRSASGALGSLALDLHGGTAFRLASSGSGDDRNEFGFVARYDRTSAALEGGLDDARLTCVAPPPFAPPPPLPPLPPPSPPMPIDEATQLDVSTAQLAPGALAGITIAGLITFCVCIVLPFWAVYLHLTRRTRRKTLQSQDAAAAAAAAFDDISHERAEGGFDDLSFGALPPQQAADECRRSSVLASRISAVVELELPRTNKFTNKYTDSMSAGTPPPPEADPLDEIRMSEAVRRAESMN